MQIWSLFQSHFPSCFCSEFIQLIVVDRYIAIVLPLQSILVTRRFRAALLSITWIFPLLIGFPYVWTSKIIEEGHQTNCRTFVSWTKVEQSIFYAVGFFIFYCVVCLFYFFTFELLLFWFTFRFFCSVFFYSFFFVFITLPIVQCCFFFSSSGRHTIAWDVSWAWWCV